MKEYFAFQKISHTMMRNNIIPGKGSCNFFLTVLFLFLALIGNATNYYVSNSGSDSNPGTSESLPWKSLDKVNAFTFSPGDQILFKRGDKWSGSIVVSTFWTVENPIIFGAYGTGEKPIIKGTTELSGWTHYSGNIYKATVPRRVNQVFVDDIKMQMPRTAGYYTATAVSSQTVFRSDNLIGTDWTGSNIIIHGVLWSYESIKVISCNPATGEITLEHAPEYAIAAGKEFFMTNHISLLTSAGEWIYNEASNTVYLWTKNGDFPGNYIVEASSISKGFSGNNVSNITIKDLDIQRFYDDGIEFVGTSCANNVVDNCDFSDNYACGVDFMGDKVGGMFPGKHGNPTISNCTVKHSNNSGIRVYGTGGSINNNLVQSIALPEDLSILGYTQAMETGIGINVRGTGLNIKNNEIYDTGYNGINYVGGGIVVEKNIVKRSCKVLTDGGGIYTYSGVVGNTSYIKDNIISDIGVDDSDAHGIYLDASSESVSVTGNTVFNCSHIGIFTSSCRNILLTGNTSYNNRIQYQIAKLTDITMINNIVSNNIFCALTDEQYTIKAARSFTDLGLTLDGNFYANPRTFMSLLIENVQISLGELQEQGQELTGKELPGLLNYYENVSLLSPNLIENGTFDSDVSNWSIDVAWDNTQLGNGCLRSEIPVGKTYSFAQTKGYTLEPTKVIKFSFDVISPNTTRGVNQCANAPQVGLFGAIMSDKTKRHYEQYFTVTESFSSSIAFRMYGDPGTVAYFDNVEMYEVDADPIAPTDKCKLFVNETTEPKVIDFKGMSYTGLDGTPITESVTLQPFSSKILVKSDGNSDVPDSTKPIQTHSIELENGWNIFSSYLNPVDINIDVVLKILQNNNQLIEVLDENGNSFRKNGNEWNNNIGEIHGEEGYKIKVNSSSLLQIEGYSITLPLNIELDEGWNIISFPYNGSVNAMEVIKPLIDAKILEKVQDEKGNSIENWGNLAGWINNIGNFNAGEGYLVQVNDNGVLPIYEYYKKSAVSLIKEPEPIYFHVAYEGNGYGHMNINIIGLNESNFRAGDEIATYDGGICVGAVKLSETNLKNNFVSVHASISDENSIDGFREGKPIELRIWNAAKKEEVAYLLNVISGELVYQKQGSVFVQLGEKKKVDEINNAALVNIFPNPASTKVIIRFSSQPATGTRIILMDITGKQLINQLANTNNVFYVENQPPGVYLVRIESGGGFLVKKLIIQ